MASNAPRSQASFFYSSSWTKQVDNRFISKLVREANTLSRPISLNNTAPIRSAQLEINQAFGTSFTFNRCVSRFRFLRSRYDAFSFIINLSGINYDELHNTLHADNNHLWDYICMEHSIGEAYIVEGEAAWHDLCQIFGEPIVMHNLPIIEVVDLTSEASESVEIPSEIVEFQPNIIQEPRDCYERRPGPYQTNTFWDELAAYNGALRSPSVVEINNQVTISVPSPPREPLPPRCLWPTTDLPTWTNSTDDSFGLRIWPASSDVSDEASSSAVRRYGKKK